MSDGLLKILIVLIVISAALWLSLRGLFFMLPNP